MAYTGTKGWYIQKLKEVGVTHHPQEKRKLKTYKTHIVAALYDEHVKNKKG